MFKREDAIVGIFSVLFGIFILISASTFHETTSLDPAGPGGVPTLLAWGILIIGLILIAGAYFAPKLNEDKKAKWEKEISEIKPVLRITLVCIIYISLLEYIGYLIVTPLLIFGIMWMIYVRNIKNMIFTSLFTTAILYLVFGVLLRVKLPMGLLDNIFNL